MVLEEFANMTDEQRRAYVENINLLANLETIRVNQFHIFNLHVEKHAGSDTTSQYLYTPKFEVGWVYIITSICARDEDDGAYQLILGVKDGATNFVYQSSTVANAGDSVEYVGQLMCKEGDQLFAEFRSIAAGDDIHLFVNGYKIRR